jgi:uncharacterized OsmC-like protein
VDAFTAVVAAGSLRSTAQSEVSFPHRWTAEGVTVETDFTGAHLLHLAVAGCVLNDIYREAEAEGVVVAGARVTATGDFDATTWSSTGITYRATVDSPAGQERIAELLDRVDAVAEIPRALRAGAPVTRPAD